MEERECEDDYTKQAHEAHKKFKQMCCKFCGGNPCQAHPR
jgi:hypothetical protein